VWEWVRERERERETYLQQDLWQRWFHFELEQAQAGQRCRQHKEQRLKLVMILIPPCLRLIDGAPSTRLTASRLTQCISSIYKSCLLLIQWVVYDFIIYYNISLNIETMPHPRASVDRGLPVAIAFRVNQFRSCVIFKLGWPPYSDIDHWHIYQLGLGSLRVSAPPWLFRIMVAVGD